MKERAVRDAEGKAKLLERDLDVTSAKGLGTFQLFAPTKDQCVAYIYKEELTFNNETKSSGDYMIQGTLELEEYEGL